MDQTNIDTPAPIVRSGVTARVSEHVWIIPDDNVHRVPNIGFVIGSRATLVIDTGMGYLNGRTVFNEARALTPPDRPLYLVTTHTHPEHDLGAHAFPSDTIMLRSRAQIDEIAEIGLSVADDFSRQTIAAKELLEGATFRSADCAFQDEYLLDLGGVNVRISAMGANHTSGDTVALVIEDEVLFSGDIVMKGAPAFAAPSSSISHWIESLDILDAYEPEVIVPSHGPVGDRSMIADYRAYLTGILERVSALKARGRSLEETIEAILAEGATFDDTARVTGAIRSAFSEALSARSRAELLQPDAELELLGTGATWSEGPLWIPAERAVRWSDIPANRILRWDAASGAVTVHRDDVEFTNGRILDRDGSVVQCSHGNRRIERESADGTVRTIVDHWGEHRLNSPNDIALAPDGSYWFTDPHYGIVQPHEGHAGIKEYGDCKVFRWSAEDGLTAVIHDIDQPNGIAFSPDGTRVYVTDTAIGLNDGPGHWIRVYDVSGSTAVGGRHFADIEVGLPDGIAIDVAGRLWSSAGDGIHVFHPDGSELLFIPVPETVANLCFGGDDGSDLFIAATTSLYRIRTRTCGT